MFDNGYGQSGGVTANSTRGLCGGGNGSSSTIQYIVVQTLSNGIDFGDLSVSRADLAGTSDLATGRACFAGGSGGQNVIDYVSIASTSNATDFGDMFSTINSAAGLSGD